LITHQTRGTWQTRIDHAIAEIENLALNQSVDSFVKLQQSPMRTYVSLDFHQ